MKLLVDGISLLKPQTGITRYTYNISKHLILDSELDITFFYGYSSKKLKTPIDKSANQILLKNSRLKNLAKKALKYAYRFNIKRYDSYWQPNFIPNSSIKANSIITTVHDFSFEKYKRFMPKDRMKTFEQDFYKSINLSNTIITGSYYTKSEILQRLDFPAERVKVIYHGVDHNIFKRLNRDSIELGEGLKDIPKNFILSVGSIEPRKNLITLIKAYLSLDKDIQNRHKLLLAGFIGWNNSEIFSLINSNSDKISYVGYIDDNTLSKLYNLASLFVYPSYYEGFGLPILEAMACGTPVLSSNTSSMPEVGGDSIEYFNPKSVDSLRCKIEKILDNEELMEKLSQSGLKRAKRFTWEKSAKEHKEVFLKSLQ